MTCPECGAKYRDLRTGETFASIRRMMFVADPDSRHWRYKRRHSVLGFWHQLKLSYWRYHLEQCENGQKSDCGEPRVSDTPEA